MTEANEALRKLVILAKSGAATDFEVNELARTVRAHLTDPGYVRVPVEPSHELILAGWFGGRIEYAMGRPDAIEEAKKYYARLLAAATKEAINER